MARRSRSLRPGDTRSPRRAVQQITHERASLRNVCRNREPTLSTLDVPRALTLDCTQSSRRCRSTPQQREHTWPEPRPPTERVADDVRAMILHGDLSPGSRLGEVELAERLGVSRTPVREALTRLGAEGLVELAPNRGARVATWTRAELEGIFDLRSSLEPRLAGLAVGNADAGDLADLDHLASRMLEVGRPGGGAGPRRAGAAQPRLPRPGDRAGRAQRPGLGARLRHPDPAPCGATSTPTTRPR